MTTHTRTFSCSDCGFASGDPHLLAEHSCDIARNGGNCEDFPCCGHEYGDCNGQKYGSTHAIQNDPHRLCEHEIGECVLDNYFYDEEEEDD